MKYHKVTSEQHLDLSDVLSIQQRIFGGFTGLESECLEDCTFGVSTETAIVLKCLYKHKSDLYFERDNERLEEWRRLISVKEDDGESLFHLSEDGLKAINPRHLRSLEIHKSSSSYVIIAKFEHQEEWLTYQSLDKCKADIEKLSAYLE